MWFQPAFRRLGEKKQMHSQVWTSHFTAYNYKRLPILTLPSRWTVWKAFHSLFECDWNNHEGQTQLREIHFCVHFGCSIRLENAGEQNRGSWDEGCKRRCTTIFDCWRNFCRIQSMSFKKNKYIRGNVCKKCLPTSDAWSIVCPRFWFKEKHPLKASLFSKKPN